MTLYIYSSAKRCIYSANLASSPSISTEPPLSLADSLESQSLNRWRLGLVEEEYVNLSLRLICCKEIDGRRWNYMAEKDALSGTFKKNSIRALIFWNTLLCFAENFFRFSERIFECCCLVAKKVREKVVTKIFFVVFEKGQERTRKWMYFKIEKLKFFFFYWNGWVEFGYIVFGLNGLSMGF